MPAKASLAAVAAALAACPAQAAPAEAKAAPMPDYDVVYIPPPAPPFARGPSPSPLGKERAARARIALSHLFQDYPAAALRASEEGITDFRLGIDNQGRVSGCAITGSSGSATLDSETCRVIALRARFHPALDSEGRPAPGEALGRVVWRLPSPPEPPPSEEAR